MSPTIVVPPYSVTSVLNVPARGVVNSVLTYMRARYCREIGETVPATASQVTSYVHGIAWLLESLACATLTSTVPPEPIATGPFVPDQYTCGSPDGGCCR